MVSEWVNSGLTSHQQRGHTETGPRFKVSSERPEKRGIDLATPGLVVQRVIHYTTAAPGKLWRYTSCFPCRNGRKLWRYTSWFPCRNGGKLWRYTSCFPCRNGGKLWMYMHTLKYWVSLAKYTFLDVLIAVMVRARLLHQNFSGSNTDGSFTTVISNLFLSP